MTIKKIFYKLDAINEQINDVIQKLEEQAEQIQNSAIIEYRGLTPREENKLEEISEKQEALKDCQSHILDAMDDIDFYTE